MSFGRFDRSRLRLLPVAERVHELTVSTVMNPAVHRTTRIIPGAVAAASRIREARTRQRPIIWMIGAHVIRQGLSRYLISMMEEGLITHLAMNGAAVIHDYELACIGATTESVSRYIREGQFGLWNETGEINTIVNQAATRGCGYGEAVGAALLQRRPPHLDVSILAAAVRLDIPVTVHVGIGQDIIHEHPNFDAALTGRASYEDFLILTETISHLEGGVYLNIGSAVMGPEVYLKALAMARNVAHQEGHQIRHFTTVVADVLDLGSDLTHEPSKSDPRYYYRPFKTILVRTVQDGGESVYIRGEHRETIPLLYESIATERRRDAGTGSTGYPLQKQDPIHR